MYSGTSFHHGHFVTIISVLIKEVYSIQKSFNTPQYYTGTQNGVLTVEVPSVQRSLNIHYSITLGHRMVSRFLQFRGL